LSESSIVARNTKFQIDMTASNADSNLEEIPEVSKSQLKRDAQEKKSLAAELIALGNKQFASAPLDESLREEIRAARKITAHVARKRQLQYVAKQLRNSDTTEIEQYLENLNADASQLTQRQRRAEGWRDFLISGGDEALAEFLRQRPDADRQAIRQLIRKAKQELAAEKPPAAARSLFRKLRDLDSIETLSACP